MVSGAPSSFWSGAAATQEPPLPHGVVALSWVARSPRGPPRSLHRYSDHTMWTAFLGLHDQSKRSASGVQERKLKRIISHPFFNDFTYDYDIAVLELEQPVEYSSTVRPICLPAASHSFPAGKAIWVTGWGHTYEGGEQAAAPPPRAWQDEAFREEMEASSESGGEEASTVTMLRAWRRKASATSLGDLSELLKL